jgi:hypothetical protein
MNVNTLIEAESAKDFIKRVRTPDSGTVLLVQNEYHYHLLVKENGKGMIDYSRGGYPEGAIPWAGEAFRVQANPRKKSKMTFPKSWMSWGVFYRILRAKRYPLPVPIVLRFLNLLGEPIDMTYSALYLR